MAVTNPKASPGEEAVTARGLMRCSRAAALQLVTSASQTTSFGFKFGDKLSI